MTPLSRLTRLFVILYTALSLLLFITVADQPLAALGHLPLNPTLCALALFSPFAVHALLIDIASPVGGHFLSPLRANIGPLGAFFAIALTSLAYSVLPGSFWGEGGKWIFLITYGLVLSTLAVYVPRFVNLQRWFPLVAIIALALLLWSIMIDFNYPGTFADEKARAAGFPGNANFAALVSVMICASALDYRTNDRHARNATLLLMTGAFVVSTMSRSGALNFIFLIGIFFFTRLVENRWHPREVLKVVSLAGLVAIASAGMAVISMMTDTVPKQSRIYKLLNNQQVEDGSGASRLFAVRESLRLINESPILGHGTGHARTMRELPHNLYLQQWVNNGIVGVATYIGFLGVTLFTFTLRRYRPGQAFILVTTLGSIFSHNILDQRSFLILLGLHLGSSFSESSIYVRRARV